MESRWIILEKEATSKQLNLIISMETWLLFLGSDGLEKYNGSTIQDASTWITNHMDEYKSLKQNFTAMDLLDAIKNK